MYHENFKSSRGDYTIYELVCLLLGTPKASESPMFLPTLNAVYADIANGTLTLESECVKGDPRNGTMTKEAAIAYFERRQLPLPTVLRAPETLEEVTARAAQLEARVKALEAAADRMPDGPSLRSDRRALSGVVSLLCKADPKTYSHKGGAGPNFEKISDLIGADLAEHGVERLPGAATSTLRDCMSRAWRERLDSIRQEGKRKVAKQQ